MNPVEVRMYSDITRPRIRAGTINWSSVFVVV